MKEYIPQPATGPDLQIDEIGRIKVTVENLADWIETKQIVLPAEQIEIIKKFVCDSQK